MKIITAYPVLIHNKTINRGLDYSNVDAKSSTSAIKQFQSWSNKIKGTNLTVDGKWGTKTAAAYKSGGADFEKAFGETSNTLANMFNPTAGDSSSSASSSTTAPKQKGAFFDKVKGLWGKAQDSGAVDKAKGLIGGTKLGQKYGVGQNQGSSSDAPMDAPVDSGSGSGTAKKGLSTPAKVGIGLGILVLLYVGYRAMKGGKPAKA